MILCCLTLFLALLVAALFGAKAAEQSSQSSQPFSSQREAKDLLLRALKEGAWQKRYRTGRLQTTLPSDFPHKGHLAVRSLFWDEDSRRFSAHIKVRHTATSTEGQTRNTERNTEQQSKGSMRTRMLSLHGKAIPYMRVVATRRVLLHGTRVVRADLKMIDLPISRALRSALTDWRQALGKEVRFRKKAGSVLSAHDLRPAKLVRRRSTVQVAYDKDGVRVLLQAKALDDGVQGEVVRLQNRFSGREFSAVVVGVGQATVLPPEAQPDPTLALDASEEAEDVQDLQNLLVAENPFRATKQRRYDKLLNEPL